MNSFRFIEAKVVLLGKNYSGKTSLLERYLHERFSGCLEATIGAAYGTRTMTVGNTRVTLGIWDTAGSERYDSMSRVYYRGAKAAVICYDLTDESSFHRAKFWVNELQMYEEGCILYLCGTKCDLVRDKKKTRDVDLKMTSEYADEINAKVFETSSKTGENVEQVFYSIAECCVKDEPPSDENEDESPPIKLPSKKPKKVKCCK